MDILFFAATMLTFTVLPPMLLMGLGWLVVDFYEYNISYDEKDNSNN